MRAAPPARPAPRGAQTPQPRRNSPNPRRGRWVGGVRLSRGQCWAARPVDAALPPGGENVEVAGWHWRQRALRHSYYACTIPPLELTSSSPSPTLNSASLRSGGNSTGDGRNGDGRDRGARCACALGREGRTVRRLHASQPKRARGEQQRRAAASKPGRRAQNMHLQHLVRRIPSSPYVVWNDDTACEQRLCSERL